MFTTKLSPLIDEAKKDKKATMTNRMTPIADKVPVQKKGRERRQKILEVARAKLLDEGVEGLVLRDVAEEIGITHGNLQYYFKTKSSLLEAIFDAEVSKYTDTMHAAAESASSKSGRIAALIDSSLEVALSKDTRLWHILTGIAHQNPELAKILQRENHKYESSLAAELALIMPDASSSRHQHIAKIIRMVIDGLCIDAIYERPDHPDLIALRSEIKVLFGRLIELE